MKDKKKTKKTPTNTEYFIFVTKKNRTICSS